MKRAQQINLVFQDRYWVRFFVQVPSDIEKINITDESPMIKNSGQKKTQLTTS